VRILAFSCGISHGVLFFSPCLLNAQFVPVISEFVIGLFAFPCGTKKNKKLLLVLSRKIPKRPTDATTSYYMQKKNVSIPAVSNA
jgi:hypothetical protein